MGTLISEKYAIWEKECNDRFLQMKKAEEEINRVFIETYGLQEELSPEEDDSLVTVRKADLQREIKSLISYLIGCLMGRYSLEQEGLIYAGGEFNFDKYGDYVDQDGVLHIYKFVGMNDGLTQSIIDMVSRVYGEDTLEENLNFIANALDSKSGKSSREILNDYLNEGFYPDHLNIYQKRPIYWMMSSGKHGAFRCLLYVHRYNKNTLALINSKYFLPRTAMYKAERERLQARIDSGLLDARELKEVRKQLDDVLACEQELLEYGQALDHMANQYIDIDLDDGVKANYAKFQGVELEVDGRTIKKDLFVPIK